MMMRASESSQDHVGHNNEGSKFQLVALKSQVSTELSPSQCHGAKTPCTKLTLPFGSEKKHKGVFAAN